MKGLSWCGPVGGTRGGSYAKRRQGPAKDRRNTKDRRLNELSLASFGHRITPPVRRSWARQSTVWALVALVHLFLLTLFVMSEFVAQDRLRHPSAIETMFLLSMLPKVSAPPVKIIRPQEPSAIAPVFTTAPLIVLPPEPPMIKPETPADILRSIGEALACSANTYEELTQAARAHCVHEPWLPRRAADGTIVLEAPARAAAQPELHMTGAEQMRHDLQTGPNCPILVNTPCLRDMGRPRD